MAGISYTLRAMAGSPWLCVTIGSYLFAMFIVAGPWIFSIVGVLALSMIGCDGVCASVTDFRSIVIYNSIFSLVITGPLGFLAARFISDQVFRVETQGIVYAVFSSLLIYFLLAFFLGGGFYLLATNFRPEEKLLALQNLMLGGAAWILIPCLGASGQMGMVCVAFGLGALVMTIAGSLLASLDLVWLLCAHNIGLFFINAVLLRSLYERYGISLTYSPEIMTMALRYWELPCLGLIYGLGLWIDKLLLWFSDSSSVISVGGSLRTMPDYDTPMFWAQLGCLPVLAFFFLHLEGDLSRQCKVLYSRIEGRATLRELSELMRQLEELIGNGASKSFIQLSGIAGGMILCSYVMLDLLGLRATQMGIFRNAALGMLFQTATMLGTIILLYFDLRRPALLVACCFLVLNGTLTAVFLPLGFRFFGLGYVVAAVISWALMVMILKRELRWILFHIFVTNNSGST